MTHHPRERQELTEKGSSEPKTASPRERVREFPDECLTVTGKRVGKPFCNVCCEKLSLQRNIVVNHIGPNKHKSCKEKLTVKEARERDIAKCLKVHDDMSHPVGEYCPWSNGCMYRLKVLKTFLHAAFKTRCLQGYTQGEYVSLDRRHMSDLVPLICAQEQADIKAEISGKPVSVVFDGKAWRGNGSCCPIC